MHTGFQMARKSSSVALRGPLGSSEKVALQVLDLNSKQVSTFPGSENLYSPRLSPDGKHLAALSSDNKKLLIFDFQTQKWTDWVVSEPGPLLAFLLGRGTGGMSITIKNWDIAGSKSDRRALN